MSKLIVNEIEKYDAGQLTITTGTNVSIGSDLTVGGALAGTLSTAAQPNVTSVGTLSSLAVSGGITGDVLGDVTGDLTGSVLTAAQTNITSVGTLSSLAVSGNLTVDTDTLFVDASNNQVGIGTSTLPALTQLTVLGNVQSGFYRNLSSGGRGYLLNLGAITSGGSLLNGATIIGAVLSGDTNGLLTFSVLSSGTMSEKVRIDASGDVEITSGNLSFANGSGIDFSASAGGGATSSLLDDYEEGTWSPTVANGSAASGSYTKIGRLVTVRGNITWGGAGVISIGGLPFTSSNQVFVGSISYANLDLPSSTIDLIIENDASSTFITGYTLVDDGAKTPNPVTKDTTSVVFSLQYQV
jgi:hypothetical protein